MSSTCQSCHQPLLPDSALLSSIPESQLDLLADPARPSGLSRADRLDQIPSPASTVAKDAYRAATATAAAVDPIAAAAAAAAAGTGREGAPQAGGGAGGRVEGAGSLSSRRRRRTASGGRQQGNGDIEDPGGTASHRRGAAAAAAGGSDERASSSGGPPLGGPAESFVLLNASSILPSSSLPAGLDGGGGGGGGGGAFSPPSSLLPSASRTPGGGSTTTTSSSPLLLNTLASHRPIATSTLTASPLPPTALVPPPPPLPPLGQPPPPPPRVLSVDELLDLASGRTESDHPLCADCARTVQRTLTSALDELASERSIWTALEKRQQLKEDLRHRPRRAEEEGLAATVAGGEERPGRKGPEEMQALERRLEQLTAEEAQAESELLSLEASSLALDRELHALQTAQLHLLDRERAFLHAHARALDQTAALELEAGARRHRLQQEGRELERLERANVWVDSFCIGSVDLRLLHHDEGPGSGGGSGGGTGKVGSINGLRLGKGSKANPVDWPEINAAWGLACFCLHALARKLDFTFQGYLLIPLGSTSKIEDLTTGATYELFGSSDAFSRFLFNKRYEHAMAAFLDCLRQLLDECRRREADRVLRRRAEAEAGGGGGGGGGEKAWDFGRYHIVKDKIGELGRNGGELYSIRSGYTPSSASSSASSTSSVFLSGSVLLGGGGGSSSGGSGGGGGGGEDGWSRACRYTLMVLHRLIGYATRT